MPAVLARLEDPENPRAGFSEKDVRATLRAMRVSISAKELGRLMLRLRRSPIAPAPEMVESVRSQLGDRKPEEKFIRETINELGLTLTYRQTKGLLSAFRTLVPPSQLSDELMDALREKTEGMRLNRDSVRAVLSSLGYRLRDDDHFLVTKILRDEASVRPVGMSSSTIALAEFLAKKTGVRLETVVRRALTDSAFGMLDRGDLRFDKRGRSYAAVAQVRLALQAIDPASRPRESDAGD